MVGGGSGGVGRSFGYGVKKHVADFRGKHVAHFRAGLGGEAVVESECRPVAHCEVGLAAEERFGWRVGRVAQKGRTLREVTR